MKIIIAGAGAVGTHLAKLLSKEHHDITLMDYPESRQILESDVLTIAQLEERTGFNFFFNLTEEEAEYAEKTLSPAMKF